MSISTKLLLLLFLSLLFIPQTSAQNNMKMKSSQMNQSNQFDFWLGKWNVKNRFLQDDYSWKDEGSAVDYIYSVLNGKGIMEFWDGTGRNGKVIEGFSLRYFNKKEKEWILALNWPQKNNGFFFFLSGKFRHRRGEFHLNFTNKKGQYTKLRYTFSDISENSLRWNNGISTDSGMTWKTNWIMEFTRSANKVLWPSVDEAFPTFNNNSLCDQPGCRRFYNLAGRWKGTITLIKNKSEKMIPAEIKSWKVLNGAAVMLLVKSLDNKNKFEDFLMITYRKQNEGFLLLTLDSRPGTEFNQYFWKSSNVLPEFTGYFYGKKEKQKIKIDKINNSDFEYTKYSKNGEKTFTGKFKKVK